MKLFGRSGNAKKKWHSKAMLIDFRKTKIIISTPPQKPKHVPPWIFRKLDASIADTFARSRVRNEYAPVDTGFLQTGL